MTSRPRQWLDFSILYTLFLLARPMPRRFQLAVGRGLGSFVWHVVRYRRDVVLDNIRNAFGDTHDETWIKETAHSFYRNLGMTLMEFLAFPWLSKEKLDEIVEVRGTENVDRLLEEGRGGMLVGGHFGNWEFLGAGICSQGYKINFIVKSQSNPHVDRVQNDIRQKAGLGIIRAGASIKEMILALRRGELIGLLADQDAGKDGIFTEFLGRPASVFRGTAYLAWKLKCPLQTGQIFRQPDFNHVAIMDPPIIPDPEWDEETAVRILTDIIVKRLEENIRKAPDQYFWLHRRWKTRPPEEEN